MLASNGGHESDAYVLYLITQLDRSRLGIASGNLNVCHRR